MAPIRSKALVAQARKPANDEPPAKEEEPELSGENMQNNMKIVFTFRTFVAIIGGCIAGILGFTSAWGFLFYGAVLVFCSVVLAVKAEFNAPKYLESWNRLLFDGAMGGLGSFLLFWTLAYDIVHIF